MRIVNLLSWRYRDPGLLLAQRIRRERRSDALHRHRRQRAAVAGQPGVPRHPVAAAPTRCSSRAPRRGAPEPGCATAGGKLDWTKQDESVPVAAGRRRGVRRWRGPWSSRIHLDRPAYVYPMFEQALRITAGESPDDHRRRIGELWSQFSEVAQSNPHAWSRKPLSAEEIWQPSPKQPDDQLAVHQADELQQHGRPGCGADPDVGGEGARISRSPPSVGFSRMRAPTRTTPTRSASGPSSTARPAIRIAGRRALELAGHGRRRHRPDRRLLVLPVGRPGGRARTRAAARRCRPAADRHRRSDVRGRAVEQLRHAFDRHHGRAAGGAPGHARPDHRQRRLPDQAQLRRLRHGAADARIPLGRRAIRRRRRTDEGRRRRVVRRRHGRVLDHAVRP